MLFLRGLQCPTQYFDWANSGGAAEKVGRGPCQKLSLRALTALAESLGGIA